MDGSIDEVFVLFGSQGGTARRAAHELNDRLRQTLGITSCILSFDDFRTSHLQSLVSQSSVSQSSSCLTTILAIMVVSTTGQGECPKNMAQFWKELLEYEISHSPLNFLQFSIFGLGDSRYDDFNHAARKLRACLLRLGAKEFHRYGLGDDQHPLGYENEFDPWVDSLVKNLIPFSKPLKCLVESFPFTLTLHRGEVERLRSHLLLANVLKSERQTSFDHSQNVILLTVKLNTNQNYIPGDVLSVYPKNKASLVNHVITDILNLDKNVFFNIKFSSQPSLLQTAIAKRFKTSSSLTVISLEQLLTECLDLSAVPDRSFFRLLAHFCSNDLLKEKLTLLGGTSDDSKIEYYDYCKAERRSAAEILWDFREAVKEVPLAHLLNALPPMEPRQYTIASAKGWHYRKHLMATQWLLLSLPLLAMQTAPFIATSIIAEQCQFKPKLPIKHQLSLRSILKSIYKWFHTPVFTLDADVGPYECLRPKKVVEPSLNQIFNKLSQGREDDIADLLIAEIDYKTKLQREIKGLCSSYLCSLRIGDSFNVSFEETNKLPPAILNSPLLIISPGTGCSLTRAILQHRQLAPLSSELDSIFVFLGFRHRNKDFLLKSEWQFFHGVNIEVAFSRDDPNRVVYVQDKLEQFSDKVAALLLGRPRSIIIISGRSLGMPQQVISSIKAILMKNNITENPNEFLLKRKANKQLIFETWG